MSEAIGHVKHEDGGHALGASTGRVGMWIFLLSDAFSFGGLLFAYAVLRAKAEVWRPPGEPELGVSFTAVLTLVLVCSSGTMLLARSAAKKSERARAVKWLALTLGGGLLFLAGQVHEYFGIFRGLGLGAGLVEEGMHFGKSAYASTFFTLTGFHGLHVLAGVISVLAMLVHTARGKADANDVAVLGLYWNFVDVVWLLVFSLVYLLPS